MSFFRKLHMYPVIYPGSSFFCDPLQQFKPTHAVTPTAKSRFDCDSPFMPSDFVNVNDFKSLSTLMEEKCRQCDAAYQPSDDLLTQLCYSFNYALEHSPREQLQGKKWSNSCKQFMHVVSQFKGQSEHLDKFLMLIAGFMVSNVQKHNNNKLSPNTVFSVIQSMQHLELSDGVRRILHALEAQLHVPHRDKISGDPQITLAMALLALNPFLQTGSDEVVKLMVNLFQLLDHPLDAGHLSSIEGRNHVLKTLIICSGTQENVEIDLRRMPLPLAKLVAQGIVQDLAMGVITSKSMTLIFGKQKHEQEPHAVKDAVQQAVAENQVQLNGQWHIKFHPSNVLFLRERDIQQVPDSLPTTKVTAKVPDKKSTTAQLTTLGVHKQRDTERRNQITKPHATRKNTSHSSVILEVDNKAQATPYQGPTKSANRTNSPSVKGQVASTIKPFRENI